MTPQLDIMRENHANALADRKRYEEQYLPFEQNLRDKAKEYMDPAYQEQQAAKQMADVRSGIESQRQNQLRELEGFGIDPSQTRSQALDLNARVMEGAAVAQAGNAGRQQAEDRGLAMQADVINIGRGMPSNIAGSYGAAMQAGQGGMGMANQTFGTNANAMQGGQGYLNTAISGNQSGADITNAGYANQLNAWTANAQYGTGAQLGQLAGAGMGMIAMSDPRSKEGVTEPRGSALEAIASTPASEWQYKGNSGYDDGARHIGPMADQVRDKMGIGDGTSIPLNDMVTMQHKAIGEIADILKNGGGGKAGGAYIIPQDVLERKGTEFFDRMVSKGIPERQG